MRYLLLACDYDGTIATHGVVNSETLDGLQRLRASGRRIVLVTGRELDDLMRVAPDLTVFDRVVAENGAVVYDPRTRQTRDLAPAPPASLISELMRRGVTPLSVGRVIVATWEPHEGTVLETIRHLGLEHHVIFNKGAVMVLPSGVNKATGLSAALEELELSSHNVVGVGDAENDHAFLSACECSVAVANALDSLKQRVDLVTLADHGAGVTEMIDHLLANDLADVEPALARRHLLLGEAVDGSPVHLLPYGEAVLIAGRSGVGKSSITRLVIERLCTAGYQFCIIDPEGDYQDIREAVSLRSPDDRGLADEAMQVLASPKQSLVVNLMDIRVDDRPPFFRRFLPLLQELRGRTGRPHWIIIDEAHHLLPLDWEPAADFLPGWLDSTLMVTVHPEHMYPDARALMRSLIALGEDVSAVARAFAGERTGIETEAPPRPAGAGRWACLFRPGVAPRWLDVPETHTERQRHRRKYAEGELGADKSFYFRGPEQRLNLRAQNLAIFSQVAEGIDEETWLYHLRNRDYSRWFRESIRDETLAATAEAIENESEMPASESRQRILQAIEERYTSPA